MLDCYINTTRSIELSDVHPVRDSNRTERKLPKSYPRKRRMDSGFLLLAASYLAQPESVVTDQVAQPIGTILAYLCIACLTLQYSMSMKLGIKATMPFTRGQRDPFSTSGPCFAFKQGISTAIRSIEHNGQLAPSWSPGAA